MHVRPLSLILASLLAGTCSVAAAATATVYYYTPYKSWSSVNMHHNGSGTWTTVPGVAMTAACTDWVTATVDMGSATSFQAVFNNGAGAWDNQNNQSGSNYAVTAGTHRVKDGQIAAGTNPCGTTPVAPTTPVLSAGTASSNSVTLTWTASTDADGIKGYGLVRGTTLLTRKTGTSFTDNGLAPNTTYKYYVIAEDNSGQRSARSNVVSVTTGGVDTTRPSTPSGLSKGTVSASSVQLSWQAATDASGIKGYGVLRNGSLVGSTASTSYTDTKNVQPLTTYKYTVVAQDKAGNNSLQSAALQVTTPEVDSTPPSKPTGLTGNAPAATVSLSWTAATDNVAVTGYEVSRATSGGTPTLLTTVTGTSYTDSTAAASTTYTYSVKARDAAGNRSAAATVSVTTGTVTETSLYRTNPNNQVGKAASITVDGAATEWTEDMIIAQGVANDDPRIFRGSHEGPVYDLYALYAAWDDDNLYLMWQFTNVTDVTDPAQGYPISDNGKPYNGDIPQSLAFDIDPTKGGNGTIEATGGGIWGMKHTFANSNVDRVAMFSSKPGVGTPAMFKLNANGKFDYTPANVQNFTLAGISFKYGDGFKPAKMMGIKDNGNSGNYTPEDLTDSSRFIDLLTTTHSKAQDTTYEMKIPFTALGITRAQLESNGIGVMLLSTFGVSPIGSLPHDPAVLDNAMEPYSFDSSSSMEKEDPDVLSVPFARIGKK